MNLLQPVTGGQSVHDYVDYIRRNPTSPLSYYLRLVIGSLLARHRNGIDVNPASIRDDIYAPLGARIKANGGKPLPTY